VTSSDSTEFQNETIYHFDFNCAGLVTDILDSLVFSETAIDEKFRDAVVALNARKLSSDIYDHDMELIASRFTINLPLTTRYSALVSFATAVAWCAEYFNTHLKFPQRQKPKADCFGLYRLQYLNKTTSFGGDKALRNYRNLVIVRDTIVHNAGIQRTSSRAKSPDLLLRAVNALPGFSLRDDLFIWFGNRKFIMIEKGALEPHISTMAELLTALNKAADEAGLLE
jgi:hypothetical protein